MNRESPRPLLRLRLKPYPKSSNNTPFPTLDQRAQLIAGLYDDEAVQPERIEALPTSLKRIKNAFGE
jgi:hypothetical protein